MGNCACIGSHTFVEELKLWAPFLIVSGIAIGVPIAVGASVSGTLIGYGIYSLVIYLICLFNNYYCNYGILPAYVDSDRRLEGITCIVTGANSGSGYCTARELVKRGGHVIITCRSQKKADTTIEKIKADLASCSNIGTMDYVLMDLASKKSVDDAIASIESKNVEISVLVNNAGGVFPATKISEDGFLPMWQANYLSPFYLTKKLLPNMKATAMKKKYGRIINVASIAHAQAIEANFEGFMSTEKRGDLAFWQESRNAYGDTKLAQILHAMKLQEILNGEKDSNGENVGSYLYIVSLQPGFINSLFYRGVDDQNLCAKFGWYMFYPFLSAFSMVTPNQGAQTSLHCILSDKNVKPGGYHGHCKPQKTFKQADELIATQKDKLYEYTDSLWNDQA